MEMKASPMKSHAAAGGALLAALLFALAVTPAPVYPQDEAVTAKCYKGNTDEGNYVGDISLNDPGNAGAECNGEYIDCEGQCVGCVLDAENNRVCFDNDGKQLSETH